MLRILSTELALSLLSGDKQILEVHANDLKNTIHKELALLWVEKELTSILIEELTFAEVQEVPPGNKYLFIKDVCCLDAYLSPKLFNTGIIWHF